MFEEAESRPCETLETPTCPADPADKGRCCWRSLVRRWYTAWRLLPRCGRLPGGTPWCVPGRRRHLLDRMFEFGDRLVMVDSPQGDRWRGRRHTALTTRCGAVGSPWRRAGQR